MWIGFPGGSRRSCGLCGGARYRQFRIGVGPDIIVGVSAADTVSPIGRQIGGEQKFMDSEYYQNRLLSKI